MSCSSQEQPRSTTVTSAEEFERLLRSGMSCIHGRAVAGQIVDNDLNMWMVNPLGPGVRLHAVIDACHSGSALDLEFRWALTL